MKIIIRNNCGEKLEFDLDDECGCGCEGCGDDADDKDE